MKTDTIEFEITKSQENLSPDLEGLQSNVSGFIKEAKNGVYNTMQVNTERTLITIYYFEEEFYIGVNHACTEPVKVEPSKIMSHLKEALK